MMDEYSQREDFEENMRNIFNRYDDDGSGEIDGVSCTQAMQYYPSWPYSGHPSSASPRCRPTTCCPLILYLIDVIHSFIH